MEKDEKEKFYKSIGKVYCPYFKDDIYFSDKGLEHLGFKNYFTPRTNADSSMRFKLLPCVVEIIRLSNTFQGFTSRNRFEYRFTNNRKEKALSFVKYYEFMAIINNRKMKVIIKQIENGNKMFFSVIPLFKEKTPPFEGDGFS
jgi:hypothetical protein